MNNNMIKLLLRSKTKNKWFDLPCDPDDFSTFFGTEDFYIYDSGGDFGFYFAECEDVQAINDLAEELRSMSDDNIETIAALLDYGYTAEETLTIHPFFVYHHCRDIAQIVQERIMKFVKAGLIQDNYLLEYVDWNRYASDLLMDGRFIATPCGDYIENVCDF